MQRTEVAIRGKLLFTTLLAVRITDINYGDHTGNDKLAGLMHEARVQWLKAIQCTELNVFGVSLIMRDLTIRYLSESFYGDILKIEIYADNTSNVGFDIYYDVSTEKGNIAKAKTGMVCYDYTAKKIAGMPDKLREFLG